MSELSKKRAKQRSELLGMPFGTASSKLKKQILFMLLCKYNENICFKCNELIETIEELSIEHKLPWEGRSAELFWDLNNIAFSHLLCNRPHQYQGGIGSRIIGPDGTAWCSLHKEFLPISSFRSNKSIWNGVSRYCREHEVAYRQIRRASINGNASVLKTDEG